MGGRARSPRWVTVRGHPGDVLRVALGDIVLSTTALAASNGRPSTFERDLFRLINDLPKQLNLPLDLAMQAGALGAVPVAAVVALAWRPRAARDVGVVGLAAWTLAKIVKLIVARGRPASVLNRVIIHGSAATGPGLPSGHAAVAVALATAVAPYLGRRGRRVV
jgi:undecaprenyl-diphosphatase